MRAFQFLSLGALLLAGLTACNQEPVDPSGSNTFADNVTAINTYATSKGLSGTATSSGLYYALTRANPAGKLATLGEELEFNYRLYVLSSTTAASGATVVTDKLVDTAFATTPVYYPFFNGSLKAGLQEGLQLMREGEQATLLVPSRLAFGDVATTDGLIPANSPVRFDVTLKRSRTEEQQIDDYIARNNLTVTERTASGLRFIRTGGPASTTATSATIGAGQTVAVKYAGRQLRAIAAFDSTKGNETVDFTLGQGRNIAGFEEGLSKLKVGERATLLFPSSLGYGATGVVRNQVYVITPNAPLRFDVEIVSVR